jgi:pimeloyl-ACP methyl ester carboxylesterase
MLRNNVSKFRRCGVETSVAQVKSSKSNGLAYEERGTGFPVVFIHGLTFSGSTWRPVVDRLADRFRCVAVDLPGHGRSAGLPLSMDEVARQVRWLVTDLGIERPVIVGHSMAAILATMYAATFPVAGVVNVDQPLDTRSFIGMLHQLEPALRGPNFTAVFEPIRQSIGVELLPEPLRSSTLATQSVRQDLVLAYWNDTFQRSPEELQEMLDEGMRRITVPYLAVFGHRLSDDERVRLQTRLSRLELEEWPDNGHMVHLMQSDRFAQRLAAFIDECSGS